jgi:hypothetical protein
MAMQFSSKDELDHVDTIQYEIDMLRFTAERLDRRDLTGRDAWVYLESFLLHCRTLTEFLGKEKPSDTDVHITNIWQLAGLPEPNNLKEIHDEGKILFKEFEPKDRDGRISQYLQHCTQKRIDPKDWEVGTMFNKINPMLCQVEKHLGPHKGLIAPVRVVDTMGMFSASTSTYTLTASIMPDLDFGKPRK